MLDYINQLKDIHKDDASIIALNNIENALTEKKYGLVWEEHSEKVDEMLVHNIPVFTEQKDKKIESIHGEGYNFLLEGDNLHSLKLLEKTHKGKIDLVYIDPPYNRGKGDFVYDDNYIIKEDGYKHSKWLSFMSERLTLARDLMKEDGLIFVSIDDNEFAQLKLLMDSIFSEENFINTFVWQRNSSSKTDKTQFTVNTEYVLLYAKTQNYKLNDAYKPLSKSTVKLYNKNDGDGRGNYRLYPLQKPGNPGPETSYDYVDNNGKVWKCPEKGWRIRESKMKALENDNRLVLTNKTLSEKAYWNERKNTGKRVDTLWNDLPENTVGSSELDKALGRTGAFDNPKPTKLIERCLEIADKNSIVLDFFAGSGTTGQAVLQANKKDGGSRTYILCTNNENDICEDVTYPRLKNIQEEFPNNLKYFKTDFVKKFDEEEEILSDRLLSHIKEMVELENMCEINGKTTVLVLTQEELYKWFEKEIIPKAKVYLPSYVLLSREIESEGIKKEIEFINIPDYYFLDELREVSEL